MAASNIHPPISSGDVFSRWTVVGKAPPYISPKGRISCVWFCICRCQTRKPVRAAHLRSGKSQSCGCLSDEVRPHNNRRHGRSSSAEYNIWNAMRSRCYNPKQKHFLNYGGRGITVCDRWRFGEDGMSGFECFIADMGLRPAKHLSIERINNDGPYAKNNCKWADKLTQIANRRVTVWVTYKGERMPLHQAARAAGLNPRTVETRRHIGKPENEWFVPLTRLPRGPRRSRGARRQQTPQFP